MSEREPDKVVAKLDAAIRSAMTLEELEQMIETMVVPELLKEGEAPDES